MADRWPTATGPDYYRFMDAANREHWLKMLAVEGYVSSVFAEAQEGMDAGDEVHVAEFDYELEDD